MAISEARFYVTCEPSADQTHPEGPDVSATYFDLVLRWSDFEIRRIERAMFQAQQSFAFGGDANATWPREVDTAPHVARFFEAPDSPNPA